jgi:hypothetical protein
MLDRLFPLRFDNDYRGSKIALWLFGLLAAMRTVIGLNSIFNARLVASTADGIPLDTFTPAGAQAAVALFALLGLSHVVISLICMLALVRYRSMIPFLFALLLFAHLCGRLIVRFLPIPRAGTPPASAINLVLLSVMIVGLALSLRSRNAPQAQG